MSFRKSEKKAKKGSLVRGSSASGVSPPGASSGGQAAGGLLPEGVRSKLWELFGQIEHEFESIYSENAAREFI